MFLFTLVPIKQRRCITSGLLHFCCLPCCAAFTQDDDDSELNSLHNVMSGTYIQLLPPLELGDERKTLVLDLDETLIHAGFKKPLRFDHKISVNVENSQKTIYISKRPHLDDFLYHVGSVYEVLVFTASLSWYADPIIDYIDKHKVIKHRLYRESCTLQLGSYVKDLSRLGRNLNATLIVDNSPDAYMLHTDNAVAIASFFGQANDRELVRVKSILMKAAQARDVREAIPKIKPLSFFQKLF
eukprot:TRINITY_DN6479_c0_g3_i3.p1 TRINITY_DN6479_c0_g3~~TRINITY_DN6479_c0_g3_i3.p1  ORF type:complete len:242 (+),score=44.87 TRINITY_DN6479_c0_g3_i3:417-1142(+)